MSSGTPFSSLEVRGLTKSFYDVAAIDTVDFDVVSGEIHGLLGENGAGKSTLCSVLAGLYRPDAGGITIDGEPVHLRSPHEAAAHGIGMVYQHFRLVDSFTVAENIVLGMGRSLGRGALRKVERQVGELVDEYGLDIHPGAYVWQLSVGEQQRVEIVKQLYRGARILILDEPTAVLAPHESERLFRAVRHMVDTGHGVVLVSHKMQEILDNTDRVTVLRDGRNAGHGRTADLTRQALNRMVFGDRHVGASSRGADRRRFRATPCCRSTTSSSRATAASWRSITCRYGSDGGRSSAWPGSPATVSASCRRRSVACGRRRRAGWSSARRTAPAEMPEPAPAPGWRSCRRIGWAPASPPA